MNEGLFEKLLDSSNRSPQAIATAKQCLRSIKETDVLACSLVPQIESQDGVQEVSYELVSPEIARVIVIIPTLPEIRDLNDEKDPINVITAMRNTVLGVGPHDCSKRLMLTIKRSASDTGYVEGVGV